MTRFCISDLCVYCCTHLWRSWPRRAAGSSQVRWHNLWHLSRSVQQWGTSFCYRMVGCLSFGGTICHMSTCSNSHIVLTSRRSLHLLHTLEHVSYIPLSNCICWPIWLIGSTNFVRISLSIAGETLLTILSFTDRRLWAIPHVSVCPSFMHILV